MVRVRATVAAATAAARVAEAMAAARVAAVTYRANAAACPPVPADFFHPVRDGMFLCCGKF